MVIKVFGIVIIFTSSTMIGIYFGALGGKRIADLRELKKAFYIIKSEIQYTKAPLGETFAHVYDKTNSPINNIFKFMETEIEQQIQKELWQIWEVVLDKYKSKTYLKEEDIIYLKDFGKCLGFLDISMQKKNIDLTISIIDQQIKDLSEDVAKNKKMFNSLGVLAGLLICILLI